MSNSPGPLIPNTQAEPDKSMLENKTITQAEHDAKRQQILDEL